MRTCIKPALMLAVVMSLVPCRVVAQGGEVYQVAAYVDAVSEEFRSGDLLQTNGDAGAMSLSVSNGLQSLGRSAWPLVREFVWLSTFAGDDLFAGYSQPLGDEDDHVMEFSLLIDRASWSGLPAAERQERLYRARVRFDDRMSELNLKGSLQIVLTSR